MREADIRKQAIESFLKEKQLKDNSELSIDRKKSVEEFLKEKKEKSSDYEAIDDAKKYFKKEQPQSDFDKQQLEAAKKLEENRINYKKIEEAKKKEEEKKDEGKSFLDAVGDVLVSTGQGAVAGLAAGPFGSLLGAGAGAVAGIYGEINPKEVKKDDIPTQLKGVTTAIDKLTTISEDEKKYLKKYAEQQLFDVVLNKDIKELTKKAEGIAEQYRQGAISEEELKQKRSELIKEEANIKKQYIEKNRNELKQTLDAVLSARTADISFGSSPNRYYIDDSGKAVKFKEGDKIPKGVKVSSIWSNNTEDDSFVGTALKGVYNSFVEGLAGGAVGLTKMGANIITGSDDYSALRALEQSVDVLKMDTNIASKEQLITADAFKDLENFRKMLSDIPDKPHAIASFIGETMGSVASFAAANLATGGGASFQKGSQLISAANQSLKAGEITSKAAAAMKVQGVKKMIPALATGTMISSGEAMDALDESGYTGHEKGFIAGMIAVPTAMIELFVGNSATDFLTNNATKKAISRAGVNSLAKNGFNLSQETIDDAYKAMYKEGSKLAKVAAAKGKTALSNIAGEMKEEFLQTAYQSAFQDFYDRLRLEEGDKSGFNKKFLSRETAAELMLSTIGGGIGGAFGSLRSVTGKDKSYLKHLTIYDAVQTGNEEILTHNLSELLQSKQITKEEHNAAMNRINAYKRFNETTKDMTELKDNERYELFEAMMNLEYGESVVTDIKKDLESNKKETGNVSSDIAFKLKKAEALRKESEAIIDKYIKANEKRQEEVQKGEKEPLAVEEANEEAESLAKTEEKIQSAKQKFEKKKQAKTFEEEEAVKEEPQEKQVKLSEEEAVQDTPELEYQMQPVTEEDAVQDEPDPSFSPRRIIKNFKKKLKKGISTSFTKGDKEVELKSEKELSEAFGIDYENIKDYDGEDIELSKPTEEDIDNKMLVSKDGLSERESLQSYTEEIVDEDTGEVKKEVKKVKSSGKNLKVKMFIDKNGNKYGLAFNPIKKNKEGKVWGTSYLIKFPNEATGEENADYEPIYVNKTKDGVIGYGDLPALMKELDLKPIVKDKVTIKAVEDTETKKEEEKKETKAEKEKKPSFKIKAVADTDTDTKEKEVSVSDQKADIEREYEKGDYQKVIQLVKDTVAGKEVNTPENLQLLTNYPKLYNKVMDIERRRQEELASVGSKQKESAFTQLRDEKDEEGNVTKKRTPEEQLNAINLIERNVAEGAVLTEAEKKEVQKIKDNLASEGYEVPELQGKKFHQGMRIIVTNSIPDEFLAEGEEIITKVLTPQINKDDTMVQTAQIEVTVGTKKGGLTKEQWLEKQKKKEKRTDKINAKYDAESAALKDKSTKETATAKTESKEELDKETVKEKVKSKIEKKEPAKKRKKREPKTVKQVFDQKAIIDNVDTIYEATMYEASMMKGEIENDEFTEDRLKEIAKLKSKLKRKGLPSSLDDIKKQLWEILKNPETNNISNENKWKILAAFKQLDVDNKLRLKGTVSDVKGQKQVSLKLGETEFDLAFLYEKGLSEKDFSDIEKHGVQLELYNPNSINPQIPSGLQIVSDKKGNKFYVSSKNVNGKKYEGVISVYTTQFPKIIGNIAYQDVQKATSQTNQIEIPGLFPKISHQEAKEQGKKCK